MLQDKQPTCIHRSSANHTFNGLPIESGHTVCRVKGAEQRMFMSAAMLGVVLTLLPKAEAQQPHQLSNTILQLCPFCGQWSCSQSASLQP